MQDTTTTTHHLPDGVYTWVAVTAWAGQPMSATVAAGRVTAWEYVNEDGTTTPAAWPYQLERSNADFMAALGHEVSEAQRLQGLVRPVGFVPAQPPTIGKARACKLHRLMSRLGIKDHYWAAAELLNADYPIDSLAALTEQQARRIWATLVAKYPQARQYAA